eukprot:CAMPEP_0174897102 /NCGR_PEP_ID=MMETSP0167-20121228/11648_1 /TAXON_ID=38298 /ORGANISM="Rhodella maculata, Strain CCMP736" /LENGTH=89 /DNA_ID=CAMNT_0016136863 /DNA_START=109 /DNA_END=375 /DNA_ORIENTATION=-
MPGHQRILAHVRKLRHHAGHRRGFPGILRVGAQTMRRILVVIIQIVLEVVARNPPIARHRLRARPALIGVDQVIRLRERVVLEVRHLAF